MATSAAPRSEIWSGKRDSNSRLRPWQGRTLPLSYSRPRRDPRPRNVPYGRLDGQGSRPQLQAPGSGTSRVPPHIRRGTGRLLGWRYPSSMRENRQARARSQPEPGPSPEPADPQPPSPRHSLSQHLRRLLGRRRVDVEPGPPLEPGDLGQLRHDLDVPVVDTSSAGVRNGALWMIRLYGGDSSARFMRCSVSFSIRARLSYSWRAALLERATRGASAAATSRTRNRGA